MFAVVHTVFTAHAYILVAGAVVLHVFKLEIKGFLNSEHGRTLVEDHRCGGFAAVLPAVVAVVGSAVADIVGHHRNGIGMLLCTGSKRHAKQ